ncbi:MAG: GNAT family N-acetyltransferase [Chloroflexota bacterium]
MQIQLFTGAEAFETLADGWDALVQKGITNTPFQYLAYQQAWWQHLQPSGATLYTVAAYNDNVLTAIGCFYLLNEVLHFNGCVEETDYLDLIVAEGNAELGWTAVFNHLISADFPDWQAVDLCNVPQDSPTRTILPKLAQEHGYTLQESIQEVCPVIELADTFDGYLASIDSKQRREVKRKLRRANGASATLKMVQPEDDIATAVDEFLVLLQQSTFEKRDWLNDGRRAVFHATAAAAQKAGTLQLLFVEVEGEKAAALFNFDYNGRIWVYNSGLNPRAYGNLSLGVVITALAIQKAVENGRTTFDFLRGDETYKYRFGAKDTTVHRIQISN